MAPEAKGHKCEVTDGEFTWNKHRKSMNAKAKEIYEKSEEIYEKDFNRNLWYVNIYVDGFKF